MKRYILQNELVHFSNGACQSLFVVIAIVIVTSLAACNPSEEAETRALEDQIARLQSEKQKLQERQAIIARLVRKGEPGIWTLDWNDTARIFEPTNLERYSDQQATPRNIVKGLNRIHSSPGIEFVEKRGATVYLRIKDPDFLTQRMGSAGAEQYLGSVVISLTSIPDVELVHFDFFEGDHASPGFYSRATFIR